MQDQNSPFKAFCSTWMSKYACSPYQSHYKSLGRPIKQLHFAYKVLFKCSVPSNIHSKLSGRQQSVSPQNADHACASRAVWTLTCRHFWRRRTTDQLSLQPPCWATRISLSHAGARASGLRACVRVLSTVSTQPVIFDQLMSPGTSDCIFTNSEQPKIQRQTGSNDATVPVPLERVKFAFFSNNNADSGDFPDLSWVRRDKKYMIC